MLELWNKRNFEEEKMESIYYVRIMKQTEFWRGKNGEYIPCLKY